MSFWSFTLTNIYQICCFWSWIFASHRRYLYSVYICCDPHLWVLSCMVLAWADALNQNMSLFYEIKLFYYNICTYFRYVYLFIWLRYFLLTLFWWGSAGRWLYKSVWNVQLNCCTHHLFNIGQGRPMLTLPGEHA